MDKERHRIQMEGDLRVRNLSEVRSRLLSTEPIQVALDLSSIGEFDTAGLQLLLSYRKELLSRDGSLLVSGASGPVRQILTFYGAQDLLMSPEAENG